MVTSPGPRTVPLLAQVSAVPEVLGTAAFGVQQLEVG